MGGIPFGIKAPHRALVTVVRAQPLPVDRVPNVGVMVLGTAEQQIPLCAVLDLRYRPLVAVHH